MSGFIVVIILLSHLVSWYASSMSKSGLIDLLYTVNIIIVLCLIIISMSCLVICVITDVLAIRSIGYFSTICPSSTRSI